jgi:hypothetical protein
MNPQIALTSVVTASVLEEFRFLKFSFELFHGDEYRWFVRCDLASLRALSTYRNVVCRSFADRIAERPDIESGEFRAIVSEKMNVMEDAWNSANWAGVIFFDADIIVTAPLMVSVSAVEGDLVLTPNYYPEKTKHLAVVHGHYNTGFVCTRNRFFHQWWQDAYLSQPQKWTDQGCMNDVHKKFIVGTLSDRANIGFWRSSRIPEFDMIPPDCEFLHAHLFQPLLTPRQWVDKAFALHCLKFLRQSHIPEHGRLLSEVLARDKSGWFKASLRLC